MSIKTKPFKSGVNIFFRWVERIEGVKRLYDSFEVTYKTVKRISEGETFNGVKWDSNNQITANGIKSKMEDFTFIFSLVLVKEVLHYLKNITSELQSISYHFIIIFCMYLIVVTCIAYML